MHTRDVESETTAIPCKKKLQICDIANCNTSQYLTPNDPEHVHDRSPIGDPQTHETAG
jgi:hypothetical protein